MTDRFFLAQDNDTHWYIVPADRIDDWREWLSIDSDDERAWEVPDFARPVSGSPIRVTFTDPEIS